MLELSVAPLKIGRMYSVSVVTVFSSTMVVRTQVPCCQSERLIFPHLWSLMPCATAMPNPDTEPVIATAEVTLAAAVAPATSALVDTPNTDTTPFAARAEATGAAAPAVPMTVARVPTTVTAMPAIWSAASSGPILQVHGSSVLLTMER
ncbi:uncharacterized protein PITG_00840 [Phytophthora infestans T30-4]|uniref:Uncharacterized protein n=1 Tax=Phytophthora infestans (strain T30-4) TaxID=403677 RepID=D0MRT3_PHYIT|nr:uncharacterized protein PITG_00840 [Phytophthora infestans T30-4]EEY58202.1 hypothetical protein PITG_00840 [Phytophthora infestans T30-4]|eukprot:XP_002909388.1 hypothetical protein PITG_00840 [Phytophthora infestans T30-4]